MISRLHYISQEGKNGESHFEMIEAALLAGVKWVQFRAKNLDFNTWKNQAIDIAALCKKHKATLIINDSVEVALVCNADGVHLGKTDMAVDAARTILGDQKIIGATANSLDDVKKLLPLKPDYIGLGPFRFTVTKEKLAPVLGEKGIQEIVDYLNTQGNATPIIAIGGITSEDLDTILNTEAHGVAIASEINFSENKLNAVQQINTALEKWNH